MSPTDSTSAQMMDMTAASGVMFHPGLPTTWAIMIFAAMGLTSVWAVTSPPTKATASPPASSINLMNVPFLGVIIRFLMASPWPLVILKAVFVAFFALVIIAGLMGTPIPEKNIATVLTWTFWWTLVVISVFFLGTVWCAVCPWNTLADWIVKHRLWRRGAEDSSLNLKVPRTLRNVWPALFLLIGLTWLELGVGVTKDPMTTALLAVLIVVMAVSSLAVFERKAFCRYFCPVGRTLGAYSQLAPVELRPASDDICAHCQTLDCYHGTDTIEPCPTHLTIGRFAQNTYCTSCGDCALSCPHDNVSWRLRSMVAETRPKDGARPHWDEAWFMLGLLGLTTFHGVTMLPQWQSWMRSLGRLISDQGQLLISFSLGMTASLLVAALAFGLFAWVTGRLCSSGISYRHLSSSLAFTILPVAFVYHLAHNLSHLIREGDGLGAVLTNPLGENALPLSPMELHMRHMNLMIPEDFLFALQAVLMAAGFLAAVLILRRRTQVLTQTGGNLSGASLLPMLFFIAGITAFNTWLLMQDMVMRL